MGEAKRRKALDPNFGKMPVVKFLDPLPLNPKILEKELVRNIILHLSWIPIFVFPFELIKGDKSTLGVVCRINKKEGDYRKNILVSTKKRTLVEYELDLLAEALSEFEPLFMGYAEKGKFGGRGAEGDVFTPDTLDKFNDYLVNKYTNKTT